MEISLLSNNVLRFELQMYKFRIGWEHLELGSIYYIEINNAIMFDTFL